MTELIPYEKIESKNVLESQMSPALTSNESLILCLDMMDFFASLRKNIPRDSEEEIKWIVLEMNKK